MNIPLLDLQAQYKTIKDEINNAIQGVLESSRFILGPNVKKLEEEISLFTSSKYGIGVANGTDALVLTLKAYGIGEGDEVITSPFTFFASAEVISQVGATPVFVDVDSNTCNIDVNQLEQKITERTKAIIPVHIFGQPVDMDVVMNLAKKYNLVIIEDACQAIGSNYKGQKIGSIGHAACFSFFPTKNLGGYGDGGMIVTDDKEIAEKLKMLRFHGQRVKYYNEILGYNSRLDELQAAILRVKLKYLVQWNDARKEKAYIYNEALSPSVVSPLSEMVDVNHVYHLYIVQSENREELIKHLAEKGIATGIYYPVPLHLQEVYDNLGYKKGDFPNAEYLSKRTFALPLYPELTEEQQQYIIKCVNEFTK